MTEIIRFSGGVQNRGANAWDSNSVFPLDLIMEIKVELIWGEGRWNREQNKQLFIP